MQRISYGLKINNQYNFRKIWASLLKLSQKHAIVEHLLNTCAMQRFWGCWVLYSQKDITRRHHVQQWYTYMMSPRNLEEFIENFRCKRFDCVTNRLIWPNLRTELFACYHIRTFHSEVKSLLTSHSCLRTPVDFSHFFSYYDGEKHIEIYQKI